MHGPVRYEGVFIAENRVFRLCHDLYHTLQWIIRFVYYFGCHIFHLRSLISHVLLGKPYRSRDFDQNSFDNALSDRWCAGGFLQRIQALRFFLGLEKRDNDSNNITLLFGANVCTSPGKANNRRRWRSEPANADSHQVVMRFIASGVGLTDVLAQTTVESRTRAQWLVGILSTAVGQQLRQEHWAWC